MAAYAVGVVKGTVEGVAHAAGSIADNLVRSPNGPEMVPPRERPPAAPAEGVGERTRFGGLNTEPAPPMAPGGGGEPFAHEPTAESRDVAHGDAVQAREVESWAEEAEREDGVDGVGGSEADREPLLDPATAKAIRHQTETLRRAADPDKG